VAIVHAAIKHLRLERARLSKRSCRYEPISHDWKQFICRACGVIYDEERATPTVARAGTRFSDIPEDWNSVCGVSKADFFSRTNRCPLSRPGHLHGCSTRHGVVVVGGGTADGRWSKPFARSTLTADHDGDRLRW